ncbi:MAG TPA: plastocyanin/azurin family copper-binding protein [Candidatus Nitrosotalea sp.]|nr:plastocyanin/azurin family copper-binding protein [Candidatus Nitrosotalea sp.]
MRLLLGFVAMMVLFVIFSFSTVMAQKTSQVTITYDSGMDELCLAEKNCFNPQLLQVTAGSTVTWKNTDQYSHTITSGSPYDKQVGTDFDSGVISPENEFSFTFQDAGTYHYFCEIHPWMRGQINVIATS